MTEISEGRPMQGGSYYEISDESQICMECIREFVGVHNY